MAQTSEEFLFSIVDAIQAKEGAHGFEALTEKEKIFFSVWTVEAEVNNGGFEQLYMNDSATIVVHAVSALRRIGANSCASIVERGNAIFGDAGPPTDWEKRNTLIESLSEESREVLELLDDEFYEYPDNLSELLAAFMRS